MDTIAVIDEYSPGGHMVWLRDMPGGYARGASRDEAISKVYDEARHWCLWARAPLPAAAAEPCIVQEKSSSLCIEDADSDVIFDIERKPLCDGEYNGLRALVLRSARDFDALYQSIPDKDAACCAPRATFYGAVPLTAREMYAHTNGVTSYYMSEIGSKGDYLNDIYKNRCRALVRLECADEDFLMQPPVKGDFDEEWSLRKVMRRFLWHDRIHAKAMWRMAKNLGLECADPFLFGER